VVVNPNGGGEARRTNAVKIEDAATSTFEDLLSSDDQFWVNPLPARAGVSINVGLIVQRNGGRVVLEDVPVEFRRDTVNGPVLGRGTIPFLDPPNGVTSTNGLPVTFDTPGEVTIFAIIDPDNTVVEGDETNNVYQRTIVVGEAATAGADTIPPTVDGIDVNGGTTTSVTSRDIRVAVAASDPTQPTTASGVRYVHMIEYVYLESVGNWVPVAPSGWLPFDQSPDTYAWTLLPQPGMRYIQVRARDAAGNVSIGDARRLLNYEPPTDSIARGQTRIYRYQVVAGESLDVQLDVQSGDADLYVWSSDSSQSGRVSNQEGSADERVRIIASQIVPGTYQVEVFGYTAATYRITTTIGALTSRWHPFLQVGGVNPNRQEPTAPVVAMNSIPRADTGNVPTNPAPQLTTNSQVFLPLVRR